MSWQQLEDVFLCECLVENVAQECIVETAVSEDTLC